MSNKRVKANLKVACDLVNASNHAQTRKAGRNVEGRENKTVKLGEAAKKAIAKLRRR